MKDIRKVVLLASEHSLKIKKRKCECSNLQVALLGHLINNDVVRGGPSEARRHPKCSKARKRDRISRLLRYCRILQAIHSVIHG